MKRRTFLKQAGITLGASAVNRYFFVPPNAFDSDKPENKRSLDYILNDEYPWPYDAEYMDSAERIVFDNHNTAWINIFVKPGKNLDIKLYLSETREDLPWNLSHKFFGVKDTLDIRISDIEAPGLFYKIEYREGKNPWKSHAPREVKTPNVDLEKDEKLKIIMIGDDHLYADLKYEPRDKRWKKDVLTGDYVSHMLKEIIQDPGYEPEVRMREIVQGFSFAWTLKYILETNPDFVISLGDTVGPDSYHVWGSEGQWPDELQPKDNLREQAKILWKRTRKSLAPITPEIPYYLVSGNHDGENGWENFTEYSRQQRKGLFRLPKFNPVHFAPMNPASRGTSISSLSDDQKYSIFPEFNGNHYAIEWAKGDVLFFVLTPLRYTYKKPQRVTDWNLGEMQKKTFQNCLERNFEVPWKFVCLHHVVGGYPLGTKKEPGAYARGPLYTRKDYEKANEMAKIIDQNAMFSPSEVEQVWLTEVAKDFNTRGFFRGHDHVFYSRNKNNHPIGKTSLGKEMITACVGSTNFVAGGEYANIWSNPYWLEFYGNFYDNPPPFWTQPGITQLEIDKLGATFKYVCSAPPTCMYSNMPVGTGPGDKLYEYRIAR
jgi:hypothetical protein